MKDAPALSPRRAWREPLVWLVWGLPALVVVAGFATLAIAIRAGGADAVPAEVRRTAQIQVEDLAADRVALDIALRGELAVAPGTGAVALTLASRDAIRETRLRLRLSHPSRADDDLELLLTRGGEAWHGRLPATASHAWNLDLAPLDARWRLAGRLEPGQAGATLRPRLRD